MNDQPDTNKAALAEGVSTEEERRPRARIVGGIEPAKPVSPLETLGILSIALFAGLLLIGSISAIFTNWQPGTQLLKDLTTAGIGLVGLTFAWLTWKVGGFSELKTLRATTALLHAWEMVTIGLHYIGGVIETLGVVGVVLTMLLVIPDAPPAETQSVARVAAAAVVAGVLLKVSTRGRSVTIEWRLNRLRSTLKVVGKNAESARGGLAQASFALAEIESELKKKSSTLDEQRRSNERLTQSLQGDPAAVAALEQLRRREARSGLRHQWLGVLVGGALGAVTTILLSDDPDLIGGWTREAPSWLSSLFR